jgi:hypothetical protein
MSKKTLLQTKTLCTVAKPNFTSSRTFPVTFYMVLLVCIGSSDGLLNQRLYALNYCLLTFFIYAVLLIFVSRQQNAG